MSDSSKPKRNRPQRMITLSAESWQILDALVADGRYPSVARALDAATQRLKLYHQRRGELPPDPPDPGDEEV